MKKKWMIVAGLVTVVMAVVGMTIVPAMAQNGDSDKPEKGERCEAFIGKVAGNLGTDVETLSSAIVDAKLEMIDQLVTDGKITQEKADTLKARIEEKGACGFLGKPVRHGHGQPGGFGKLGMLDRAVENGIITQAQADKVVTIFEQVKTYCAENGRPEIGPRDGEMLNRAVEEGIITQEQADTITEVMDAIKAYAQENGIRPDMKGKGFRGNNDRISMQSSELSCQPFNDSAEIIF